MLNSEYLICVLVEPHEQDEIFTEWPLHITLVTWFKDDAIWDLQLRLIDVLNQTHPMQITIGQEKEWGEHTVNIIEPDAQLRKLHELLIKAVRVNGKILINEEYMDENFTPHSTKQKSAQVHPGQMITIENIYIIKKNSRSQLKTVLHKMWID